MVAEQTHRYPRWMTWLIELLCAVLVTVAAVLVARDVLRYLWTTFGVDTALSRRLPLLTDIVLALGGGTNDYKIYQPSQLLAPLAWLMLALLLVLLLRNSLPTVRTSPRGMLVEFAGDWLPIPWESLVGIKVTEDFGAERFVLLAETNGQQLTGWHRMYSFIYRFGVRRGFLITSGISNFEGLVQTLLSETDRVARVLDKGNPVKLQEDASSPLFRFMLGPASFFSRRDTSEVTPSRDAISVTSGGAIQGSYPIRISALFTWGTMLLALLVLARYIIYWLEFAALQFGDLRRLPVFDRLTLLTAQFSAPWWVLVAGHLMVLIMLPLLIALRNMLPELEARGEGLAVRYFNRWLVVPWSRVSAIKVTELSEDSQVVLIQANSSLPFSARLSSLLYDGSFKPGVLVTSALSTFEPLLQRVVLEVTRHQQVQGDLEESPIFQSEAYSPLLLAGFRPSSAIDRQVEQIREDESTKQLDTPRLLRVAPVMVVLAALPTMLMLMNYMIEKALLPNVSLLAGAILIFVLGVIEWPLVGLGVSTLDEMTGGGEEGSRPLYIYPPTQLPRILPLLGALVFMLLGVPIVPMLFWLGAIVWSFLLAAGLWSTLYDWRGGPLLAGGLIPVVFQLLVLLAYLFVLR
jgi:hypothetical protein